ncbi:MAG TPA: luciferase family protein [Dongiaceae bacterium]|nr:luciferase family protein [Dongiaceae bacterium]
MAQGDRVKRLVELVSGWPGVTAAPHRFGGVEFRFGRGEIGHVHPEGLVDVPFPRPVRDRLVSSGRAQPHHVLPESGWVSFLMRTDEDLAKALEILRLSYELRVEHEAARKGAQPGAVGEPALEDRLDEALEESFPASDPPAVSRGGTDDPRP